MWINRAFHFQFKVIPPPEWSANSKKIPPDFILSSIVKQKPKKLALGGFDLLPSAFKLMSFENFVKFSEQKKKKLFGTRSLSIEEIENLHWEKLCSVEKCYSLNNSMSLFGDDVNVWNLDRFTKSESNIHGSQTHHTLDVSLILLIHMQFKESNHICS